MEAGLDDFFAIGTATAEPALEFFFARGEDKDACRLGVDLVEVHLAEHVEVEQDSLALLEHVFYEALGRAVVVPVHLVPFNKPVFLDELLEILLRLEEVVYAIDFAFAGLARSCRYGINDVRKFPDDLVLEGGLACAARGTHHEKFVLHDVKFSKIPECDLRQTRKRKCDFTQINKGLECDLTQSCYYVVKKKLFWGYYI